MKKNEYIRKSGIYLVGSKKWIASFSPPLLEQYSWISPDSRLDGKRFPSGGVITLLVENAAPTEKIEHELLSCFSESTEGLRLLIAVSPFEKNKLYKAAQKPFENRRLWFTVDPENEINGIMKEHGFFPDKKYERKLCIYDCSAALFQLMASVDVTGVQCVVSVNCSKKINSVYISEDFLSLALTTTNGLEVSILNERFKWTG